MRGGQFDMTALDAAPHGPRRVALDPDAPAPPPPEPAAAKPRVHSDLGEKLVDAANAGDIALLKRLLKSKRATSTTWSRDWTGGELRGVRRAACC